MQQLKANVSPGLPRNWTVITFNQGSLSSPSQLEIHVCLLVFKLNFPFKAMV